jgi:hypothetical protein
LESLGVELNRVRSTTLTVLGELPPDSADLEADPRGSGPSALQALFERWSTPLPSDELLERVRALRKERDAASAELAHPEGEAERVARLREQEQELWQEQRRLDDEWRARWRAVLLRIDAIAQSRGVEPVALLEELADQAEWPPAQL